MQMNDTTYKGAGVFTLAAAIIARPPILTLIPKTPMLRIDDPDDGDPVAQQKREELVNLCKWGWVNSHALTDCVNQTLGLFGATPRQQMGYGINSIFDLFGALNGHVDGEVVYTYITPYNPSLLLGGRCEYKIRGSHPGCSESARYVPARWANAIIDMIQAGIVKVTFELHHPTGYYTIGHTSSGEKKVLFRTSDGGKWHIRET